MRKGKRRGGCLLNLLLGLLKIMVLISGLMIFFFWSNRSLQVTYTEPIFAELPEGFDGCRIAILSDLHGAVFGKENQKLFQAVSQQNPEYIFYLGDLEDAIRGAEPGYPEQIARGLTAIAPTWYVTGNHEWGLRYVPELKSLLRENGVHILTNEYVWLERNDDRLLLAGIDDPNANADQKTPETLAAEIYADCGNVFWILLAHRNNCFPNRYSLLGADLVLSGHGHGGIIRLPFTDGLISTERTLFPSYTAGLYKKNGSVLFVTRGLGNSGRTFRLFNRPEIAMLTLRKGG